MLRFGSCEPAADPVGRLASGRLEELAGRARASDAADADPGTLRQVATDFASLLYSMLLKEMQKTVRPDEDEDALAQGVRDFVPMLLPQAIAGRPEDPVAEHIYEQLSARYGDSIDERA